METRKLNRRRFVAAGLALLVAGGRGCSKAKKEVQDKYSFNGNIVDAFGNPIAVEYRAFSDNTAELTVDYPKKDSISGDFLSRYIYDIRKETGSLYGVTEIRYTKEKDRHGKIRFQKFVERSYTKDNPDDEQTLYNFKQRGYEILEGILNVKNKIQIQ